MRPNSSPYAALGLEPGATRAAVEEAYRRLIKQYHPDRSGGDAARAAEINRAYFELRHEQRTEAEPIIVPQRRHYPRRRPRRSSRAWPLAVLCGALLLFTQGDQLTTSVSDQIEAWSAVTPVIAKGPAPRSRTVAFDAPLAESLVSTEVGKVVALRGDAPGLAKESRACHRMMRDDPDLSRFDRCAAFDTAVAVLENRAPEGDSGPFNASAVTTRLMTAASLLTDDYLGIEARLNRIRTRVEMILTPRVPLPDVQVDPDEPVDAVAADQG